MPRGPSKWLPPTCGMMASSGPSCPPTTDRLLPTWVTLRRGVISASWFGLVLQQSAVLPSSAPGVPPTTTWMPGTPSATTPPQVCSIVLVCKKQSANLLSKATLEVRMLRTSTVPRVMLPLPSKAHTNLPSRELAFSRTEMSGRRSIWHVCGSENYAWSSRFVGNGRNMGTAFCR